MPQEQPTHINRTSKKTGRTASYTNEDMVAALDSYVSQDPDRRGVRPSMNLYYDNLPVGRWMNDLSRRGLVDPDHLIELTLSRNGFNPQINEEGKLVGFKSDYANEKGRPCKEVNRGRVNSFRESNQTARTFAGGRYLKSWMDPQSTITQSPPRTVPQTRGSSATRPVGNSNPSTPKRGKKS